MWLKDCRFFSLSGRIAAGNAITGFGVSFATGMTSAVNVTVHQVIELKHKPICAKASLTRNHHSMFFSFAIGANKPSEPTTTVLEAKRPYQAISWATVPSRFCGEISKCLHGTIRPILFLPNSAQYQQNAQQNEYILNDRDIAKLFS
jgi:hypothetical protein